MQAKWSFVAILKKDFSDYDLTSPAWHWDDIEKFSKDNENILNYYNNNFSKLCLVLNDIHQLNWNERAWKILIGPWFRRYVNILYDRV